MANNDKNGNGNPTNPSTNPNGEGNGNGNGNPGTETKQPWYRRLAENVKIFGIKHPKIKKTGKVVGILALAGGSGYGGFRLGQKHASVNETVKTVYVDRDSGESVVEVTEDTVKVRTPEEILEGKDE